jgi:hypothetical protein
MRVLTTIAREAFGMFVDDGRDAATILVWLAAIWLLARQNLPPWVAPVVLFAGLAGILIESAVRRARKGRVR